MNYVNTTLKRLKYFVFLIIMFALSQCAQGIAISELPQSESTHNWATLDMYVGGDCFNSSNYSITTQGIFDFYYKSEGNPFGGTNCSEDVDTSDIEKFISLVSKANLLEQQDVQIGEDTEFCGSTSYTFIIKDKDENEINYFTVFTEPNSLGRIKNKEPELYNVIDQLFLIKKESFCETN